MHRRTRAAASLAAVAACAAALLVAPPTASAATCAATPTLLSRAPVSSYPLPGGASVRIWDTGNLADNLKEVRLAVVRVPAGTLTPSVATSSAVSSVATPSTMVSGDPNAVVAINAGHFNPNIPGVPVKWQQKAGTLRKASSTKTAALAVYPETKTVSVVTTQLGGTVASSHGRWPVAGLNWQTLPTSGISLYTRTWGSKAHPYGPLTVVVAGGVVTRRLSGSAGAVRPLTNETFLTAPSGSWSTALGALRVGDAVTVTTRTTGSQVFDAWPHASMGTPTGLTGLGGTIVDEGVNKGTCGSRDENLRPRSAVAWLANGDMLVVAVGGRATVNGVRWGGATVHQFGDYLKRLGAVTAINLDGGTSTTLLVRRTVGGPLVRLDRSMSESQRAVVDALVWRAV